MGLIKAAFGAVGGVLADSWKDAIHCPAMDNTIILREGVKNDDRRSSNTKGSRNVISNGSVILVEENTCMLTIDGGKITNVVSQPGAYTYNNSSAPSIFAGDIGESVEEIISRFTFGGGVAGDQRVVFINLAPLPGIPFGTGTPIPYPDPRYNTTIDLRFYGTFEIQIENAVQAVRFYQEVAGKGAGSRDMSVTDVFKTQQYKSEFLQAMTQALSMCAASGLSYSQIGMHLSQLTAAAREATQDWSRRGFTITSVGLGPITLSDESKALLGDRLKADTMLNTDVQRAMMTGAVARGIEAAGSNAGGAMVGFMGVNAGMMAGQSMGLSYNQPPQQQQYNQQQQPQYNQQPQPQYNQQQQPQFNQPQPQQPTATESSDTWVCSCGEGNSGRFCSNCGQAKPVSVPVTPVWMCPSCHAENTGKFCAECGSPKIAIPQPAADPARPARKQYRCNRCGFIPENPARPPRFCPRCGDVFNQDDEVK
jgi:membrane protease subunit (stomatin/prohibitin family)